MSDGCISSVLEQVRCRWLTSVMLRTCEMTVCRCRCVLSRWNASESHGCQYYCWLSHTIYIQQLSGFVVNSQHWWYGVYVWAKQACRWPAVWRWQSASHTLLSSSCSAEVCSSDSVDFSVVISCCQCCCCLQRMLSHSWNNIIAPIPWGHSGPLCHALSSSSSSWTSMRRRRAIVAAVAAPGEWQCKTARSSEWAQHFPNASCYLY